MAKERTGPQQASGDAQGRGRPKGAGRIRTKYTVVATPVYMAWMGEFMEFAGEVEVSDTFREAIRRYASALGFRPPPRR